MSDSPVFDRAALEKRRDTAIERGERWPLSVSDLYEAYKGGMRDFCRANLIGANLRGAYLIGANLEGANLEGANLEGAYLIGANLEGANLRGANLEGANLRGANLEGAYLRGADLRGANLRGANLEGANLRGANLEGAYLEGANLRGANLRGANLEGANLEGAYLEGANLRGANLEGANLIKAISGVGDRKRLIFAYLHDGEIRIQAGCRNGTPAEIRKAVKEDYAKDSDGYADYLATVKYLEDWGKRELKKLKAEKPTEIIPSENNKVKVEVLS